MRSEAGAQALRSNHRKNPPLAGFSWAARRLWPVYTVPSGFFLSRTKMTDSIVLFESQDHEVRLDVGLREQTVWLSQEQMATLFGRSVSAISRHISNAIKEGEIDGESNLQKVQIAGSDRSVAFYDLDVIISVGYRVKSRRGVESQ